MRAELKPLNPYELWMVRSNLAHIKETGIEPAVQVAQLRANGYPRIAAAVEAVSKAEEVFAGVQFTCDVP